jgi:hypothetical protein
MYSQETDMTSKIGGSADKTFENQRRLRRPVFFLRIEEKDEQEFAPLGLVSTNEPLSFFNKSASDLESADTIAKNLSSMSSFNSTHLEVKRVRRAKSTGQSPAKNDTLSTPQERTAEDDQLNNLNNHLHKSPLAMLILGSSLIVLLYTLKRLRQYYMYNNRKSNIKRYFDFRADPAQNQDYSGVAGDEFDELLVGVFENDDYTQFDDDDSDESIGSILSEWSGKHSQGGHNKEQPHNNGGGGKQHMEMVDLDLGSDGGLGGIVTMDMDAKLNLQEQNG